MEDIKPVKVVFPLSICAEIPIFLRFDKRLSSVTEAATGIEIGMVEVAAVAVAVDVVRYNNRESILKLAREKEIR
jgi:hypothetical protein